MRLTSPKWVPRGERSQDVGNRRPVARPKAALTAGAEALRSLIVTALVPFKSDTRRKPPDTFVWSCDAILSSSTNGSIREK